MLVVTHAELASASASRGSEPRTTRTVEGYQRAPTWPVDTVSASRAVDPLAAGLPFAYASHDASVEGRFNRSLGKLLYRRAAWGRGQCQPRDSPAGAGRASNGQARLLPLRELVDIGEWKTRGRNRKLLGQNADNDVRGVTTVAFASDTPESMRHGILTLLNGVRQRMASAVLTVWRPEEYTIFDWRATQALDALYDRNRIQMVPPWRADRPSSSYRSYLPYVRSLTRGLDRPLQLRAIDRALWQWSFAEMP